MPQTGSTPSSGAGAELGAHVLPRDELGQDRDGDLLLGGRPEIEPRRRADAQDGLVVETRVAQRGQHRRGALRARHEPDVAGFGAEGVRERALVAVTHRRDDHGVRACDAVRLDAPADDAGQLAERAGRGALAHHGEERGGEHGLDQDLHDSFRGAFAFHPGHPRLAVRKRAQRLADDRGLGARAADPAGERAVGRDDRPVAALGRRGLDHIDDGRKRIGPSGRRKLSRLDDDVSWIHSARPTS